MFILGSLESAYSGLPISAAEALRAKIDRKSAISLQRDQFYPTFRRPPIVFARIVGQWLPHNFVADSFHAKKLCSRLSSSVVRLTENGRFVFWAPFGGLGATYNDHLRLIGKPVMDFLLVLIELFSLGVTAEAPRAIIGWKSAISNKNKRCTVVQAEYLIKNKLHKSQIHCNKITQKSRLDR